MQSTYLIFLRLIPGIYSWSMGGVAVQKQQEPVKIAASEAMLVTAGENLAKRKWAADLTRAASGIEPNFLPVADFCLHVRPGSYGNPNYHCRIYHVCQADGRFDTMPCPETLRFSDQLGVCDWPNNVNLYCHTVNYLQPMLRAAWSVARPHVLPAPKFHETMPRSTPPPVFQQQTRSPSSSDLRLPITWNKVKATSTEGQSTRPAELRLLRKWSSLFPSHDPAQRHSRMSRQWPRHRARARARSAGRRSAASGQLGISNKYWRSNVPRRELP